MATVVYPQPSPWDKFPQAMQQIVAPIKDIVEQRLLNQDMAKLAELKSRDITSSSGAPLSTPAKSPQELLPDMKSEQGRALLMKLILQPPKEGTTIFSPQGVPIARAPGAAQILPQDRPTVLAPGSTAIYGGGQTIQAPSSPYQQGMLNQGQQRIALEQQRVNIAAQNANTDERYRNWQMSPQGQTTGKARQLMDLAGIFGIKPTRENLDALNRQFLTTNNDFERYALTQAVNLVKENLDWSSLSPQEKAQRLIENKNLIIQNYAGQGGMPGDAALGQPGAPQQPGQMRGWTPAQGPRPTPQGYLPSWW